MPFATVGTVYLVGAGPGDPKLITVGGREALERADVVVYDRLAHPRLLKHAPENAELIFAGKTADRHSMTQDQINATLAEQALMGRTVVRLKGGDPFVFGRGGEEAEYLLERGVRFVVIPGVTSAIAAPAYAGIPVTHRDDASSFAVITGHERAGIGDPRDSESATRAPGDAEQRRRWDYIAHAADTLIFLMGVESIGEIAAHLMENGRAESTPVAMIRWGTWAGRQQTLTATLATVTDEVRRAKFKAPAVTVVGQVARWHERLRWWDNRPLSGRGIVVTRAREQASALVDRLEALGAETVEFPTIRTRPPVDDYAALDAAIGRIADAYHWIVFTSPRAVEAFFERLSAQGRDSRSLGAAMVAAVGDATATALAAHGIRADFVPEQQTGEEIARAFPGESLAGVAVLIPRAADALEALPAILIERGASVEIVTAYETVPDSEGVDELCEHLADGAVDCVTFTSSSTVKNFLAAFGADAPDLSGVALACIGPSTAQTARELFGREPELIARQHTIDGLIDALTAYYAAASGASGNSDA